MRVIILGSGGFIASSVEKKLKKKKINVVSFSRNKLDLTKSNSHKKLKKIIKKNDYVFFASAKAPVKNINMLIYNLQMLKSVSDGIDPLKIKKFIYLSSDAVYADTKKKITENSIISSDNLHGQMHRTREIYFEEIFKNKICIIRPTLVFGPEDPHNGYGPNKFIRDAKNNNFINLFGKGEERRDHIFIDDLSYLISEIITKNFFGKINLATGKINSFYKIAKCVLSVKRENNKIIYLKRQGPMPHLGMRSFDIKKLKNMFPNYKFVSINKIIKDVLEKY